MLSPRGLRSREHRLPCWSSHVSSRFYASGDQAKPCEKAWLDELLERLSEANTTQEYAKRKLRYDKSM